MQSTYSAILRAISLMGCQHRLGLELLNSPGSGEKKRKKKYKRHEPTKMLAVGYQRIIDRAVKAIRVLYYRMNVGRCIRELHLGKGRSNT